LVHKIDSSRCRVADSLNAALEHLKRYLSLALSDVRVKGLCEEIGGEGILQFRVLEADVGYQRPLPKDIVEVSLVPKILIGEVLCKEAISLTDGHQIKCNFLIFHRGERA